MAIIGYVVGVEEIELGWGDRPDGFIVAFEKDDIDFFVKQSKAFDRNSKEYSVLVDTPKLCELTEQAKSEIESSPNKCIWVLKRGEFKEYVLRV